MCWILSKKDWVLGTRDWVFKRKIMKFALNSPKFLNAFPVSSTPCGSLPPHNLSKNPNT
jgi:hypothetical protein